MCTITLGGSRWTYTAHAVCSSSIAILLAKFASVSEGSAWICLNSLGTTYFMRVLDRNVTCQDLIYFSWHNYIMVSGASATGNCLAQKYRRMCTYYQRGKPIPPLEFGVGANPPSSKSYLLILGHGRGRYEPKAKGCPMPLPVACTWIGTPLPPS